MGLFESSRHLRDKLSGARNEWIFQLDQLDASFPHFPVAVPLEQRLLHTSIAPQESR